MLKIILRLFTVAALGVSMASASAPSSYTGILTDNMCTKKHMMPGKPDSDCVRACIKDGAKFALVSGGKAYGLKGDLKSLDKFAGQKVTVTGSKSGTVINIMEIKVAVE